MPDNMRYDANGQPLGYGDPMDPSLYGQPDPYGQYAQPGYSGAMPSPQELYAQQQYVDPASMQQPYMDPNQMYADPSQGMYGAQPMQADPYGQYPPQGGYLEPYAEPDPYMQQMGGYAQPQAGQSYGQAPAPAQQPYGQAPAAQPAPQAAPAQPAQAAPSPSRASQAPANLGPAPSSGKATLCMILGILSVIFALIPPIGIALGIVVRHMSGTYMKQGGTSPKADTGRIFATVGLVFSCIMLAVFIFLGIFIYAGLYGEGQARTWAVFYNNSPFGNLIRIPIPNPLG